MRINIVLGPFYPVPTVLGGAVEKVHLLLAGAYRDAGHKVTIISRRFAGFPDEQTADGICHVRLASRNRSSNIAVNLLLDLIYSVRVASALPSADVTVTNGFFQPVVIPRRRAGKIYVQVGRYPKGQIFLYSRADRLQAVSRAVGKAIVRQAPWLKNTVRVIGYAVPDQYFVCPAEVVREAVVLYVGRIAREKGIELLLDAFAKVPRSVREAWRLRVVGPDAVGQGGDGPDYLAELRARAQVLGIWCEFAGPIFEEHALIREYRRAAIFVYPSLAEKGESFGLAPLEAMAGGCAVIVSDLECFEDYMEHGVTGLKFQHRRRDAVGDLAANLAKLMTKPDYGRQLAVAGNKAADRFRVTAVASSMLGDFESLLAVQPRS